jgi:hypothetical protein
MTKKQKDLENVKKREALYSPLARKEGLGARKRAKKEEAVLDEKFSKWRKGLFYMI